MTAGVASARPHGQDEGSTEPRPRIGDHIMVFPCEQDPYIFEHQRRGRISSVRHDGFMIELYSAVGEWGPLPAGRLVIFARCQP